MLCGIVAAVYVSIERNAERVVSHELAASAVVFDRVWQLRNAQLETSASLLARDFGFRAAVATRDQATIRSALQNLRRRVGMRLGFVIGAFDAHDHTRAKLEAADEDGWAITAGWRQPLSDWADLFLQAQQIDSRRPGRVLAGDAPAQAETVLQTAVRLHF